MLCAAKRYRTVLRTVNYGTVSPSNMAGVRVPRQLVNVDESGDDRTLVLLVATSAALRRTLRCALTSDRVGVLVDPSLSYYHGRISREEAVKRLTDGGYDGSFLLRMSETQDGVYTISVM